MCACMCVQAHMCVLGEQLSFYPRARAHSGREPLTSPAGYLQETNENTAIVPTLLAFGSALLSSYQNRFCFFSGVRSEFHD